MEIRRNVEESWFEIECRKCMTEFEMDENEFMAIDATINTGKYRDSEDGYIEDGTFYFECPVCKSMRRANEIKKKFKMSDGRKKSINVLW